MITFWLAKLAAVFVTSVAVGVMYRAPHPALLVAAGGAVTGFLTMLVLDSFTVNHNASVLAASLVVGVLSEVLARIKKYPATIFLIPGFLPLVPGKDAYLTMRYLVEGQNYLAIESALKTLFVGAAIAIGLFVAASVFRMKRSV